MTRYEQGFLAKCAEYGVDGMALLEKKADMEDLLMHTPVPDAVYEYLRPWSDAEKTTGNVISGTGAAIGLGATPVLGAPVGATVVGGSVLGALGGNAIRHIPVPMARKGTTIGDVIDAPAGWLGRGAWWATHPGAWAEKKPRVPVGSPRRSENLQAQAARKQQKPVASALASEANVAGY